jgi:8-oxo-dGTP pyrophosphatase MutT (NUDIX family)
MAHLHEKIDFCVDIFIVNDNAVLLRMHEKYNMWLAVGGHVELDEDPVEAALRESKEETGLDVTLIGTTPAPEANGDRDLLVPHSLNRHRINDAHEHISFVYFATSLSRETNPAPGEKRDGFKWFTKQELDDASYGLQERIKICAEAALEAAKK